MKGVILTIFLILACLLVIAPVMAESVNGTLGSTSTLSTYYTTNPTGSPGDDRTIGSLYLNESQFTQGLNTLVRFDGPNNYHPKFNSNTPPGNTTRFNITYDAGGGDIRLISTGTFGYQRAFGFLGLEQPGYQWFVFDNWNVTGITGAVYFTVNFENMASLDGLRFNDDYGETNNAPAGSIVFVSLGGPILSGNYMKDTYLPFENRYVATKPSGLGIQGEVNKTGTTGTIYSSIISVYNATDGALFGSDYTVNDLNFHFNIPSNGMIIIGATDSSNQHYNSTPLFSLPITPTVTPTPLPNASGYSLTLNPTAVTYGGNVSATITSTIDPTLANIQQEWYTVKDVGAEDKTALEFYETGSAQFTVNYLLTGGNWMGWDYTGFAFNNNKGASMPNGVPLIFTGSGGTKTVSCTITLTTGQQYVLTGTVVVGQGSNYITTHIQAIDGMGGGLIYGPEIDILTINTGLWKNATYSLGAVDISSPPGSRLSVYGSRLGYVDAQLLNIPVRDDITYELPFYSGVTPSGGNQTFFLRVINNQGVAIPGALVRLTKSGTTTILSGTTSTAGSYAFTLTTSTLYNFAVSKTGYQSASGSFTTTADPSGQWVVTLLAGANPTATVTTPHPSGVPTSIIPNATTGNFTGFWAPFYKSLTGMGAQNSELGLLMTMFLVIFGLIGGAVISHGNPRVTSGCASAMFIMACAFGWIYFWIILAGICWLLASFFLFGD